jgi:RES domain-containing protein
VQILRHPQRASQNDPAGGPILAHRCVIRHSRCTGIARSSFLAVNQNRLRHGGSISCHPALGPPGWPTYTRLINSAFPPIDLFEDIADPADWALLARAEGRTNPRIAETIGQLDLVPPGRRVSGPGASYVMAPFVHCSPDRPGRFHDGTFGAFYAARDFETAVAETVHHVGKFLAATAEAPGWLAEMRELIGTIDRPLVDLREGDHADLLAPEDYAAAQSFARQQRQSGADGLVYNSVRQPGGECFAAFWPDVMAVPTQGRHLRYHWNGNRVDMIRELTLNGSGRVFVIEV